MIQLVSSRVGNGGDAALLRYYHALLPDHVRTSYTIHELQLDYELCLLDLFRWMLGAPWSTLDPEGMLADATSYGRILPNRSLPHAKWLVAKVANILETNPVVVAAAAAAAK